jgi:hypothetical protein
VKPEQVVVEDVRRQVQKNDLAVSCNVGVVVLDLGDDEPSLTQERGGIDARSKEAGHSEPSHDPAGMRRPGAADAS